MVRVTVEVARGATRYRVAVRAGSERRALEIVEKLSPGGDPRVVFTDAPVCPPSMVARAGRAGERGWRRRPQTLGPALCALSILASHKGGSRGERS